MASLTIALTFWQMGLVSDEDLIAWVDKQIIESDAPADELLQLSMHGPKACLKLPEYEYTPRPMSLSFMQEFSLRAVLLNLTSSHATTQFIKWATGRCMGEDLDQPEVNLSYVLDHLAWDCDDMPAALQHLIKELPLLLPHFQAVASSLLGPVRDLKLNYSGLYDTAA